MSLAKHLYPVEIHGKEGYIDAQGEVVIDPQYDWAHDFHEGLAEVATFDSAGVMDPVSGLRKQMVGFIDAAGQLVAPIRFDFARQFSQGRAAVLVGKKWGFIDVQGNLVIEPQFDNAFYFTEGLAPVEIGSKRKMMIDLSGNVVFEIQATAIGQCHDGLIPCLAAKKWSYLDPTGATAFSIVCTAADRFSQGRAGVLKKGKQGFINIDGAWAIPPQFAQTSTFSEGHCSVEIIRGEGGKIDFAQPQRFGYIDRDGNMVIEPAFAFAQPFSEGLAAVRCEDLDHYCYIDMNGQIAISAIRTQHAEPFVGPLARIQDPHDGSSWYINRQGDFVWPKC